MTRTLSDVTALIPAAGLGTRMVPATKEMPKEMLPVPFRSGGKVFFKPFIQLIFENLYNAGIRTFVIVVGRGKRILQDHFIADKNLLDLLERKGKKREASILKEFYTMVENSTIIWVDQPQPRGLGDAVRRGLRAVTTRYVLVHLGDIHLYSNKNHITSILQTLECSQCHSVISLTPVKTPQNYGVAVPGERPGCDRPGEETIVIRDLIEKPEEPPSNLAITGIYLIPRDQLFNALQKAEPNKRTGEIELTDALRLLVPKGMCGVIAAKAKYLDIGRPERYLETIRHLSGDSNV